MKTLTLCRHAKSSWKYETEDIYRPLNKRGIQEAPLMARRRVGEAPDGILCSPAVRTYSTALAYIRENQWSLERLIIKDLLFEAGLADLLASIKSLDTRIKRVWLFGHNPGLNLLVEYLGIQTLGNIVTNGRVHLELPIDDWRRIEGTSARLVRYLRPGP